MGKAPTMIWSGPRHVIKAHAQGSTMNLPRQLGATLSHLPRCFCIGQDGVKIRFLGHYQIRVHRKHCVYCCYTMSSINTFLTFDRQSSICHYTVMHLGGSCPAHALEQKIMGSWYGISRLTWNDLRSPELDYLRATHLSVRNLLKELETVVKAPDVSTNWTRDPARMYNVGYASHVSMFLCCRFACPQSVPTFTFIHENNRKMNQSPLHGKEPRLKTGTSPKPYPVK